MTTLHSRKLITWIVVIAVAVFSWRLFQSDDAVGDSTSTSSWQAENAQSTAPPLTSAIEPITVVEWPADKTITLMDKQDRNLVQSQFEQATEHALVQQWDKAETIYRKLINQYPQVVEPYINLAAVYAKTQQLEEARKVLLQGMNANPNYAVLFANLQSIHGALAAVAYRAALEPGDDTSISLATQVPSLDLSFINSIDLQPVDLTTQQALLAQVSSQQKELNDEQNAQQRILQLEAELADVNNKLVLQDQSFATKLAEVEAQLSQQALALTVAQSTMPEDITASRPEVNVVMNAEIATLESEGAIAVDEITSPVVADDVSGNQQNEQDQLAIATGLVQTWAKHWSEQDVSGYVARYVDNYTPSGSQISHSEWLEQREVRLTNKKFIQVDVSDFTVQESDDQLSVTFSQRYRSNTIDDTIRKRLVFSKSGQSWLDAKIIDEAIVRN